MLIPDAVSGVRNDARDASDDAFAPIGQIVDGFAILEGRVFISRQGDHLFVDQPRHIVGVALVQVDGELHEAPELALGRDLPDGYAHKDIYMCMMKSVWWAAKVGQFVGVPWGEASRRGLLSMQIRLSPAPAWGIRCDTHTVGLYAPMCRRMVKGGGLLASCWIHSNFWNGFGVFVEGWKGIISSHKSVPWGLFDGSGQMDQWGVHNGVLSAFQARFASLNASKRNEYS